MDRHGRLATVSVAQLASGVAGMAVAVGRGHPYDFLILHGRRDRIPQDSVLMGTALSAPVLLLAAQGITTGLLVRRRSALAERALRFLGAAMVVGYLGESLVRRRLRPSGWDRVESPLALTGIALAAAMAIVGRRSSG